MKISGYHASFLKRFLDLLVIFVSLPIFLTLFVIISLLIFIFSGSPIFFKQKRVKKNGDVFAIYKFRTMLKNAEQSKHKYLDLNQADGPVFKIRDDPRFTIIGKVLSRTGLDELPQFINVIAGEMCIVGPRPLPVNEAKGLSKTQKIRELVKPGITSSWVVGGSHNLSFNTWMKLDEEYVTNATFLTDVNIVLKTILLVIKFILKL